MSAETIKLPPQGPSLSIFDFDGTLFRSPAPTESALTKFPNAAQPTFAGGLGWFQSSRTLAPPCVPLKLKHLETSSVHSQGAKKENVAVVEVSLGTATSAASSVSVALPVGIDHFDKWFITPTVAAYLEAKSGGHKTAILTGREKTFASRIQQIVEDSGFQFDHLFLKQNPKGGTVKFKVEVFMMLIQKYQPKNITYYEDRPEQGAKIVSGLADALTKKYPDDVAKYYIDNFAMVMVDPSLSDSLLDEACEAQLIEELLADARAEAQARKAQRGDRRGGRN